MTEYTTWFSAGQLFPYSVVCSITLLPGQAIRCFVSNTSQSKEMASRNRTLPEKISEDTLVAFQQAIDAEVARRGDPPVHSLAHLPVIAGSTPIHVGIEISCGNGLINLNLAGQFKVEHDACDALLTAALQRHVQQRVATRQPEISVPPATPAQSDPGARVEEITNPSEVAPMTVFFIQPAQEIQAIRAVTGVHLLFYDGGRHRAYLLEEFDAALHHHLVMDHPGAPVAVEDFRKVILQATDVKDHRGRVISLLEDGASTGFHLSKMTYSTLLGDRFDEQDAAVNHIRQIVHGAITSITPFTVPVQSYLLRCELGAPCVDETTLRQLEAATQARG